MFGRSHRKKRRKKSLTRSMQRLVLVVALVILLAASILSGIASSVQFSSMFDLNCFQVIGGMRTLVNLAGGFREYAEDVLKTWESIPEKIRKDPESEAYKAYFAKYESGEYVKRISELLSGINTGLSLGDMYFAAILPESGKIIYLMDPEGADFYEHSLIGKWEALTQEQIAQLMPAEGGPGYFTENSEKYGPLRVYGEKIFPDGKPCPILAMYDFPTVASVIFSVVFVVIYFILLGVLIILIVIITRRLMKKRLVKPINTIMLAAEQYVQTKQDEGTTTCFSNLDIHTGDELEELSVVMAQMEQDIGVYEQDLTRAASEKAQMATELSVARSIQTDMLPDAKSAFPDRKEFSIFASMNPAREVGGDFYDFFLIDEDHLGIVIADVSGKGIPAALFMMSSMIVINNYASLGFSPKEVLEKANTKICASNVLNMFVTVWFGILDLQTGEVAAANAGHEYPALCTGEKGFELMHEKHGLVIGGMEGVKYREYTFTLEKEGILYIYTDGVPEATNAENELYGTDRMLHALNQAKDRSVEEICQAVQEDINGFVKDAPQFDDTTMVCLRYHGKA